MDCAELGPVQALFDGGRPGIWKINLGANADDIEPELARGRNFHRREPTHASSNSWKKPIATSDLTVVDGRGNIKIARAPFQLASTRIENLTQSNDAISASARSSA
jgi:hypothetical protein